MARLYIECSYLVDHNFLNTGIQRVVRKVIENMQEIALKNGYELHLVSLRDGYAKEVTLHALYPPENNNDRLLRVFVSKLKKYIKQIYYRVKLFVSSLLPWKPFQQFMLAPKNRFGLNMILYNIYRPLKLMIKKKNTKKVRGDEERFLMPVDKEDILLILDSSWYMNIWKSVDKFKEKGGTVFLVVYDLIPIKHPEFCDDFLVGEFKKWIDDSLLRVDGYIAISQTVAEDVKEFQKSKGVLIPNECYEYFYLGADFSEKRSGYIRDKLKNIFDERETYISVSTLEPRKNHAYLLDAFEILWKKGIDINLLFIGRQGWKVEELMQRIVTHPMKNKKLFYFDDISDVELNYAYSRAKALLFASKAEGFGLPIIEGLVKGLPVFASDTKIHREVGGENVNYFDLSNPYSLVKMLENSQYKKTSNINSWLSWKESTEMLMDKIIKLSQTCCK